MGVTKDNNVTCRKGVKLVTEGPKTLIGHMKHM